MVQFVKCGRDLTVNRNDVASLEWDRSDNWSGGDSYLVITLNSGLRHKVKHQPHTYDGADCYAIEKAITDA